MRILFLTLGDITVASSRTRVFEYLPYFKKNNIFYKVLIYTKQNISCKKLKYYHVLCGLKLLLLCLFFNIIFIQKVLLPHKYLKIFKIFKKKIIFDFDDAIYTFSKSWGNYRDILIKKNNDRFISTISISDLVILENEYNKNIVEPYNSNILIITGPINTDRYFPVNKNNKENIVIGWIGSPSTTVYLEFFYYVLEILSKKYKNICFKTIGASPIPISIPNVNLKQVPWDLNTEVRELQEFDIGIMPLPDDQWTRGKGGYKLLQYMAIGIPSLASPVGINKKLIINNVNGFLVNTQSEWIKYISFLIENPKERERMGKKAKTIAETKYSYHVYARYLIDRIHSIIY